MLHKNNKNDYLGNFSLNLKPSTILCVSFVVITVIICYQHFATNIVIYQIPKEYIRKPLTDYSMIDYLLIFL